MVEGWAFAKGFKAGQSMPDCSSGDLSLDSMGTVFGEIILAQGYCVGLSGFLVLLCQQLFSLMWNRQLSLGYRTKTLVWTVVSGPVLG